MGNCSRLSVLLIFLWCCVTISINGQENHKTPPDITNPVKDTIKDFRIRVGVEEVRLDAVILDKKGHQVTDLTADDFEISQDGTPQKIVSCTYIRTYQGEQPPLDKKIKPTPVPMLEKKDVRRMIAFVVDNLSMTFEQVHYARMALKKFVEMQMQPGDVVAILKTAQGSAAQQLFSNDKQYLLKAIQRLQWIQDQNAVKYLATQYMAIDYFIRALEDMPGRKALIMMTPFSKISNPKMGFLNPQTQNWADPSVDVKTEKAALDQLADRAMRAGVVIHTLDITGLDVDDNWEEEWPNNNSNTAENAESDSFSFLDKVASRSLYHNVAPYALSKKTGGLFIAGSNWFTDGIGPVAEALKGYYILTYELPKNSFMADSRSKYHRTKITMKRSGLDVYSRDGFIGSNRSKDAYVRSPMTVRDALFSPFRNNDLDISLASGYIHDPKKGYVLRYHMHLDGKKLSVVQANGGVNSIYLDVACITSSMDQFIQDVGNIRYEFRIKNEDVPWIKKYGLKFALDVPVKKPGVYYVRAAVSDKVSGKSGSAYQFIEIPDLKKSGLALSSLFVANREGDEPWSSSQTMEKSRNLLYPDMRRDPRKSPALRRYLPGESFEYTGLIYNAIRDGGKPPELEAQSIIYGNGKELYKSKNEAIDLKDVGSMDKIPFRKRVALGSSLQPGDYHLALQAKDARADEKYNTAIQGLDFTVVTASDFSEEDKSEGSELKEIELPSAILDQYVGTYKMGPGLNIMVMRQENRLFTQINGMMKIPLSPKSETTFFMKALPDAENEFIKNDSGEVTHMIMRRGAGERQIPRISNKVVERKEIELSSKVLEQYVGTYKLDKGEEIWITLENGFLYSQIPGQKMYLLCPESGVKFFLSSVANAENEFVKNDKGTVTHVIIRQDGNERKATRISKKVRK
jgi:VWFA-related protein